MDWEGMILARQELAEIWEDDPDAAADLGYIEDPENWIYDDYDDILDGDLEDQLAAILADADLANQEDREDHQS